MNRVQILGCVVDNLSLAETLDKVEGFVASGRPHQQVGVNVDILIKARNDPGLLRIINECDLVNADGMAVVWASRLLGTPLKERVAGIDLFDALVRRAAERGWRVYFLGAREEVVASVAARYASELPQLRIAGYRNGYWKEGEADAVARAVGDSRAELLFVATSSPHKEAFIARQQPEMKVAFAMGVGGSFDVVAGRVRRAPLWMRRSGLEWFYRFLQEPRRMFRRYFVEDVAFVWLLLREVVKRRGTPSTGSGSS